MRVMNLFRTFSLLMTTAMLAVLPGCGGGHDHGSHAEAEAGHGVESADHHGHAHDDHDESGDDHGHAHDDHGESKDEDEHAHDDHDESHDGHGHEHGEHEESGGAEYDEDKGITLMHEAEEMIGVETVRVSEQLIADRVDAVAQVFKKRPDSVLASALVPDRIARQVKPGQRIDVIREDSGITQEGTLLRIDAGTATAVGQVEAIVQVDNAEHAIGTFLQMAFHGDERKVLAMPKTALLDAATGKFAYVKSGENYLKKTIGVGMQGDELVEVLEGLQSGDEVVSQGVQDLWLIELRFTKGGGHSH